MIKKTKQKQHLLVLCQQYIMTLAFKSAETSYKPLTSYVI